MRFYYSYFLIITILISVDIYSFKAIWLVLKNPTAKKYLSIFYWLLSLILYVLVGSIFFNKPDQWAVGYYSYISIIIALLLLFYIPKLTILIFHFFDDFQYVIRKSLNFILKRKDLSKSTKTGRRAFITKTGIIMAAIPFASFAYGIVWGRHNFTVYTEKLKFNTLPKSFNGFKIVQISDLHLGNFTGNYDQVERIKDLINLQNPDIIVFTGDMVNNSSHEMDNFLPLLKAMKAKYGKYSILGNHDYGDYTKWRTKNEKKSNFGRLISLQEQAGFTVLKNENCRINIDNQFIQIIGLENWGKPPFPKYGNLSEATKGIDFDQFTLLLSHDPSHWDAEVMGKTNIDLTLAGHTHGMQFAVEISGLKWSPAQYKYPRWAGLYSENNQYLYMNRGTGYIGMAARIGVPPEITLIELQKK